MPWVSAALTSDRLVRAGQRALDLPARVAGRPARAELFLQLDDPQGWLLVQVLRQVSELWDLRIGVRAVAGPDPTWVPRPELRAAWAWDDVRRFAPAWTTVDVPEAPPSHAAVVSAWRWLAARYQPTLTDALEVLDALWAGADPVGADTGRLAGEGQARAWVEGNARDRRPYGYGDGLRFAGVWYPGVDRVQHLTAALDALARRRRHGVDLAPDWRRARLPAPPPGPLRFYFSFRSPYAAIAAARVFDVARRVGREVEVRLLPPLVTRGHGVPATKRLFLFRDAAREAHRHGIPFGRVRDPLEGWRDGAALAWHALRHGSVEATLRTWSRAVWAEGADVLDDGVLRRIAREAGLGDVDLARVRVADGLDAHLDESRAQLEALGLWGVPCVAVGDVAFWGQDRLDALEAWLS
jgi:2-hydroxychromene-2-carboxylate isomerase